MLGKGWVKSRDWILRKETENEFEEKYLVIQLGKETEAVIGLEIEKRDRKV